MRHLTLGLSLCFALAGLFAMGSAATAEIGVIDNVPAATLLLPYFEVDLDNTNGFDTVVTIGNARAEAALAHVVLWTDEAIPTFSFNVYLTGFDLQTIDLRDLFAGKLPVTADKSSDPADTVSPKGFRSQDVDFPGPTPPCSGPIVNPALDAAWIDHVRKAHTGRMTPLFGGCAGYNHGDNIARGYLTIDLTTSCNLSIPGDVGYFNTFANFSNVLWGDYTYQKPATHFTQSSSLVRIESCTHNGYSGVGNGAGHCPFSFANGDYTFYGRYNAVAGQDQSEPLPARFATSFVSASHQVTDLIVWRDTKTRSAGTNGAHTCGGHPSWYPLWQTEVLVFDRQENPRAFCSGFPQLACFPLATQRVHLSSLGPLPVSGWVRLGLDHTLISGDPFPGRAQAWVTSLMTAAGTFDGALNLLLDATQLDSTAIPQLKRQP